MYSSAIEPGSAIIPHSPLRISFLTVMPSPYMQDLFQAMAADRRIELRVHYLEMSAPDTHWGHPSLPDYAEVLPGRWFWLLGGRVHYNPGAMKRVLSNCPDVVVVQGYSGLTNQLAMRSLRRQQIPWVFFGEIPGMSQRGTVGRAIRAYAQRPAVQWPSAIAAIGSRARHEYLEMSRHRIPVENIPYCCNLRAYGGSRRPRRDSIVRFLYCGQLIHRKGVDLLMKAFVDVARSHPWATLTFVGEGPLRETLQSQVPTTLSERITFAGFQPVEKLPEWFRNADVLVLPSRHDGWGVVVNQAAGAGLAIVCSDAVGAAADLTHHRRNGLVFASENQSALASCLADLASDPSRVGKMGECSRELALQITPEVTADRWYSLCRRVVASVQHNAMGF